MSILHQIMFWTLLVVGVGAISGASVALIGGMFGLSVVQVRWFAVLGMLIVWYGCGAVAQYVYHANPWGWMAPWAGTIVANALGQGLAALLALTVALKFGSKKRQ